MTTSVYCTLLAGAMGSLVSACGSSSDSASPSTDLEAPATSSVELYFECETLDETVAMLKAAGPRFEQDPTDMSYLWREARLRDPDGYDVRLYFAGVNRLDPPWKVKARDLREL